MPIKIPDVELPGVAALIERLRGTAQLSDGSGALSMDQMAGALERLDDILDPFEPMRTQCIALPACNTLNGVLAMLYFLTRRINFFVLPAYGAADAVLPAYCDRVARIDEEFRPSSSGAAPFRIEANPAYNAAGTDEFTVLRPGRGAVVFTSSGSTGQPKYICFDGDRLVANAYGCIQRLAITETSRVLLPVPVGHMFGLGAGFLPALLAGADCSLIDRTNIVRLLERQAVFGPDTTLITPSLCKMLLLWGNRSGKKGRYVSAGEKIRKDVFADFEAGFGPLTNLYGCTEMGAMATTVATDPYDARVEGQLEPLPGVNIAIPAGGRGEIWCRHPAGYDGYLDPDGRWLAGPAQGVAGYATRDLGVVTDNGRLTVLGRIDHSLNRSGFLVALQEVESRLEEILPGISQAIVFETAIETLRGTTLVAVCEMPDGPAPPDSEVRNACRDQMPGHWVPDIFYFTTAMPRLANNKPDRSSIMRTYSSSIHHQ